MTHKSQKIFNTLVPFLILGTAVALFLGLLFVFAYVLIWGLIIGSILWVFAVIKNYFFSPQTPPKQPIEKEKGRIIDHDDQI